MRTRTTQGLHRTVIAMIIGICLSASCGDTDGGSHDNGAPRMPAPGDPAFGAIGNALVSDAPANDDGKVNLLWVGFNTDTRWEDVVQLDSPHREHGVFIGGRVIADKREPLGFRFDPDTSSAAEIVPDGNVTSIDRIRANPDAFAQNQPFGRWVVRAEVIERVSAGQ